MNWVSWKNNTINANYVPGEVGQILMRTMTLKFSRCLLNNQIIHFTPVLKVPDQQF